MLFTYASVKLFPLLMFYLEFLFLASMTVAFSLMFCMYLDGGGCNFSHETGWTTSHEINNSLLVLCRGIWSWFSDFFTTQSFKSGLLLFTVFVEGSVTSTPYILCVSPLCVYVSLHCVLCVLSVKVTILLLRRTASMLQFPLLFAAVLKHLIWLQKTVASHGSADVKILNSMMATKQIIFFTCSQSKEQQQEQLRT